MIVASSPPEYDTKTRALQSAGRSADPIYRMVQRAIAKRWTKRGTVLDVGCGAGQLRDYVREQFDNYVGIDIVRYEDFPKDAEFHSVDIDTGRVSLADGTGDVVVGVETIEHLENPRSFFRELVRLTRPGGWVIVTTPNQLSLLNKITYLFKNQFNAFQEAPGLYPSHITALLEIDLVRMARESKLQQIETSFSHKGRIIGTTWSYPHWLARKCPRNMSDNVLVVGEKPREVVPD